MGGQEKQQKNHRATTRKPSLFQSTGLSKPEAGSQSAHAAPRSEQPADQAAQTPASPAAPAQSAAEPEVALDLDEQPTPPRLPIIPAAPSGAAPTRPEQSAAASDGWSPPSAEDTIAKFLNDVADIAPQPARERQENLPPPFFLPSSVSPEAAERKRDNAKPFLSEMQSTNLVNTEANETRGLLSRGRQVTRRPIIWVPIIVGIVLLGLLAALAVPLLAARHQRGPTLRPTPTGPNTLVNGPTPTPVTLQSLQVLLQEQAPACSGSGQDFWDFSNLQKSCASDGLHLTNTQQIPVVGELISINGASPDPDTIVVMQVRLTIGKPTDTIGLVTRFSAQNGYFFGIDAAGHWQVSAWQQVGGQPRLFGSGASTALRSGLDAANTLEVISEGSSFTFYVNQTWLYSFSDNTYSAGHVGLAINGAGDQAIFSNFNLYDTPEA